MKTPTTTTNTFYYHKHTSFENQREQAQNFARFYAERNSANCKVFCRNFPKIENTLYKKVYLMSVPGFIIMPLADAEEWEDDIDNKDYERLAVNDLAHKYGMNTFSTSSFDELMSEIADTLYPPQRYTHADVEAIVEKEVNPVRKLVFVLTALLILSAFVIYHYATAPHLF